MTITTIETYSREIECFYDGDKYSVRDNGAVFRHPRVGKRARRNDNIWTFGKENSSNPYLHLSKVRVHRLVATAFHGPAPEPTYVVDHIDTNCRNNRPENLRWLTRLENSLKNPITRKKIEFLCGSIEAFLENPSMLNDRQCEPSFEWMRTVTPEEAINCKMRMHLWVSSKNSDRKEHNANKREFESKIYKPVKKWEIFGREPGLEISSTPWCAQYMWRSTADFPCCPKEVKEGSISEYFENLKRDRVFTLSEHDELCPNLFVVEKILLEERLSFLVICRNKLKRFSVIGAEYDKRTNFFVHFHLGSYSIINEAQEVLGKTKSKTDWWGACLSLPSGNRF
jgi:hypothetical protein